MVIIERLLEPYTNNIFEGQKKQCYLQRRWKIWNSMFVILQLTSVQLWNDIQLTLESQIWTVWVHLYVFFFPSYCKCVFLMMFLIAFSFSLAWFIVRIQYIMHITNKICINWLFMLSVRLPVNSRLLVGTFLGNQKLYSKFGLRRKLAPLNLALFKGQLYI